MRKKSARRGYIFAIIGGAVILGWTIARATGMLQFYKAASMSGFPTLEAGDWIFATKLGEPKRFRLVCFNQTLPGEQPSVMMFRICGMPGDRIQIRRGVLSVNGQEVDQGLPVAYLYRTTQAGLGKLKSHTAVQELPDIPYSTDSVFVFAPEQEARQQGMAAAQFVLDPLAADESIAATFGAGWNQDFFGPILVPDGKYFMLGDNRRNAYDSRYTGFIDRQQIAGYVLGRD